MWCILDRTYDELWCNDINYHYSASYYTIWTLNFERILSLCQNQQEDLTYDWDPKFFYWYLQYFFLYFHKTQILIFFMISDTLILTFYTCLHYVFNDKFLFFVLVLFLLFFFCFLCFFLHLTLSKQNYVFNNTG